MILLPVTNISRNQTPVYALRTRFAKDIVAEFVPAKNKRSGKVVILCAGMPSYPSKCDLMFWLAEKNYWVIMPRYRGTWESGGRFLERSPHEDIADVMGGIQKGFRDLFNDAAFRIAGPEIYLIGSSFGGPAVLLNGRDKLVRKIVAISPVIDWRADSEAEPMDKLESFTRAGFGNAYRFKHQDFVKLTKGGFYNPATNRKLIDPGKTLIFHAQDDRFVPIGPAEKFSRDTGCRMVRLKEGGHLSLSIVNEPKFWRTIRNHFK